MMQTKIINITKLYPFWLYHTSYGTLIEWSYLDETWYVNSFYLKKCFTGIFVQGRVTGYLPL